MILSIPKKILSFFILHLSFFIPTSAQECTICINSKFEHEYVYYQSDTFLIVNYIESYSEEMLDTGDESSILMQIKNKKADTLLSFLGIEKEGYEPGMYQGSPKEELNDYVYTLLHPVENEDWEEPTEEYYTHSTVYHIGAGIFSISEGHWEYGGGAHGYGHASFGHYDAITKLSFDWDDVFKKGAQDFVYEIVKKDMEYEGKYEGMTEEEVDEVTAESRYLSGEEYYFTSHGLEVIMQSYERLYDVFYGGYPGYQNLIPYVDLKKFIIKDSPIWRLMKAEEK